MTTRRDFLQAAAAGVALGELALSAEQKSARVRLQTLVLEGTPYNRGLAHGKALKDSIRELVALWKADLAERFKTDANSFIEHFVKRTQYATAIKKWTPDLLDEIKGIAEGAGLDFDTIYVFQLMDESFVNGAAIVAEHCSSLGWPKQANSPTIIAQNMDLEGFRNGFQVLLHIKYPGSSLEAVVLSHAGLIGWNGMNNKGVGVCCNTLSQLAYCRDGLPVNCIVRGVLQQSTEADAVKFVQEIKHASGQNYIIGGLAGVSCLECSAGKVSPFKPDKKRGLVWHTNHPLVNDDLAAKQKEKKKPEKPDNSAVRLRALETRLGTEAPALGLDLAKTTLTSRDSAEFPVCRPLKAKKDNFTFACTIMVLSEKPELHIAPGPPDMTPFQKFAFGA